VIQVPPIIAGIFDGPWMFFVLVLMGALINWLTRKRTEQSKGNAASEPEKSAESGSDWEARLRRLLGEEILPQPVKPPPTRPPQPGSGPHPGAGGRVPPLIRSVEPPGRTAQRPPPIQVAPVVTGMPLKVAGGGVAQTVKEFQRMDPAVVTPMPPLRRSRASRPLVGDLRNPASARQAFLGSVIFGPPKGLEG